MPYPELNDVIAILARHTHWGGDEGDRLAVNDYLDRQNDVTPLAATDDTDDNGQNVGNEVNDQHDATKLADANRADAGTAKTATAKPGTSARTK